MVAQVDEPAAPGTWEEALETAKELGHSMRVLVPYNKPQARSANCTRAFCIARLLGEDGAVDGLAVHLACPVSHKEAARFVGDQRNRQRRAGA